MNVPGSFRDPSGFVFCDNGVVYRQVNKCYREDFDHLMQCGLYDRLVQEGRLVAHEAAELAPADPSTVYQIIKPTPIPFISYPYEWCFSQLCDAALQTLAIHKIALEFDMILKDASAYNIQFLKGRPIFIDTLSFTRYTEGEPWIAYRQFCQHFLAPLALMSYCDIRLAQLLRSNIDGVPLDLAAKLLPRRTWWAFSLASHIHLHARSQRRHASETSPVTRGKVSRMAMQGLIDSLEAGVRRLNWRPGASVWGDYYDVTNYSDESFRDKQNLVAKHLRSLKPGMVWDLGANTGVFSRIASENGADVIAFDFDPAAVEKNYKEGAAGGTDSILPLVMDLTNASPALGWAHEERSSLVQRGPADVVMALALIHHLAIGNNVPLKDIASFFCKLGKNLVIEFVPKSDSQVKRMLSTREDIFDSYSRDSFESAFGQYFDIVAGDGVAGSERTIYLMKNL